jgi:hypothetical protein
MCTFPGADQTNTPRSMTGSTVAGAVARTPEAPRPAYAAKIPMHAADRQARTILDHAGLQIIAVPK